MAALALLVLMLGFSGTSGLMPPRRLYRRLWIIPVELELIAAQSTNVELAMNPIQCCPIVLSLPTATSRGCVVVAPPVISRRPPHSPTLIQAMALVLILQAPVLQKCLGMGTRRGCRLHPQAASLLLRYLVLVQRVLAAASTMEATAACTRWRWRENPLYTCPCCFSQSSSSSGSNFHLWMGAQNLKGMALCLMGLPMCSKEEEIK